MSKKEISFEEALDELEKIAEKLERGQLSLEDSIKAYERGMELKSVCTERLKEVEGKIESLSKGQNGKIVKENVLKEKEKEKPKSKKTEDEEILF